MILARSGLYSDEQLARIEEGRAANPEMGLAEASVKFGGHKEAEVLKSVGAFLGMDFIDLARPSFDSALLGKTLCGLLERLPVEAREQLIESVYKIISASDAATFNDLADTWLKSAAAIAMELFRTDSQTRKLFLRTLSAFLSSAAQALSDSFAPEEKK